jgi:hypothetical protein
MTQYLSLATLVSLLLHSSVGVATADPYPHSLSTRQDLQTCLDGLNVTLPNDPDFASESLTYNARLSFTPAAIVHPSVNSLLPFALLLY